ncbi:ER membrane protein complex subunit 3, partial [Orchesella cincta]
MADDLVLDPDIRVWVFVPIIIITFLVGIVRHYVSILLSTQKKVELLQVQDSQAMIRARVLRENGKYLPEQSFLMRRHFFNDEDTGYFKTQKRQAPAQNPMSDPNMVTEMLKGNVTNGWINWTFSGFVCSKVPFPLTLRFKPMLQRGVELQTLDASWVSSLHPVTSNARSMSGAAMAMPQDPKAAFKAEWEALEVAKHSWVLKNADKKLIGSFQPENGTPIIKGRVVNQLRMVPQQHLRLDQLDLNQNLEQYSIPIMDFRDKLLSSELRHVTELVNMLSYEVVILQDFLTEEFGRKYKKFRSTHVFASESTQEFAQTRRSASTGIRNLGKSNAGISLRDFRSGKKSRQQEDPLAAEHQSTTSQILILQNPNEELPSRETSKGSIIAEADDDEVDEEFTETKLLVQNAANSSNQNSSSEDEEMDSDSDTEGDGIRRLSWSKDNLEAEASRIGCRKIVRCPKCKTRVSAVAKRMQRHREKCTGEARQSNAGKKREDIVRSAVKPVTVAAVAPDIPLQRIPSPPVDDFPRTSGKPKGLVWSHFEKFTTPENQIIVKCKYCTKRVSNHATRMARHLQNCDKSPIKNPENLNDVSFNAEFWS